MPTLAELYPDLFGGVAPTEKINKPGFGTGLKTGLASYPVGIGRAIEDFGPEETQFLGTGLREYGEGVQRRNPTTVHDFESFAESPWQGVKELTGQAIGSSLPALIPYVGPVGRGLGIAGRVAAGAGVAAAPSYGQIRETQIQEGTEDRGMALAGAGAVGLIEQAGGIQRFMPGMGPAAGQLYKEFAATPLRTAGRAWMRAGLEEGAEELAQGPIEQYAGGQDPSEHLAETAFGGFAGTVGGLAMGSVGGIQRGMQHANARDFIERTLGSNAELAPTLEAMQIQRHLMGQQQGPEIAEQWYDNQILGLAEKAYDEAMQNLNGGTGSPFDILKAGQLNLALNPEEGPFGPDVSGTPINPYDVGGQVMQGVEPDLTSQQYGLFGGGGAELYQPSQSAAEPFTSLPAGQPMQAFPHSGQVMSAGQDVENPVSRAAAVLSAVARGGNVIETDRQWAEETLKKALPPARYQAFVDGLHEQARARAVPKKGPIVPKSGPAAPAENPFVQAFRKAGGLHSPALKELETATTPEQALELIRNRMETQTSMSQKVLHALEELHKQLAGETFTVYLRRKEAEEKAKQAPSKPKIGGQDAAGQTVLQGDQGQAAGVQPVREVQAQARAADPSAGRADDQEHGETVQVGRTPAEVQEFVLQKIAERNPRIAKVMSLRSGWGNGGETLTFAAIGERLKISGSRAEQIYKEALAITEQVVAEHDIKENQLIERETNEPTAKPGDAPRATPESSFNRPSTAAELELPTTGEDDATGADTGYKIRDASQINSSNIGGEVATDKEGKPVAGSFRKDQEGKANERAEAFEKAVAENDIEKIASQIWDASAHMSSSQGEKIKPWDELDTPVGHQTRQAFIAKIEASLEKEPGKVRDALQNGAFRKAVKQTYYSYNRLPVPGEGRVMTDEEARGSVVGRAVKILQDSGLGHLVDHVRDFRVGGVDGDVDAAVIENADGTFDILIAERYLDSPDNVGIEAVLHEFGHIADFTGPGPSTSFRFLPVFASLYELYKSPVWSGYLRYPFSAESRAHLKAMAAETYSPADREEGFRAIEAAEAYAQGWAAYMVPHGRRLLERDAPAVARYFKQEVEREKANGRANSKAAGAAAPVREVGQGVSAKRSRSRAEHLAFHGTPHSVHENGGFTTQKIGTGEGSQSYGWGLYFSSLRSIAAWYRRKESDKRGVEGRLYEVELAPMLEEYLDWDKPLIRQSERVKQAFAGSPLLQQVLGEVADEFPGTLGADESVNASRLYTHLAKKLGGQVEGMPAGVRKPNFERASKVLLAAGIPGITYKGETSSRENFVIFDDKLVSIKSYESRKRSAVPGASEEMFDEEFKPGDVITFKLPWVDGEGAMVTGIVNGITETDADGREVNDGTGTPRVKVTYNVDGKDITNSFSPVTLRKTIVDRQGTTGSRYLHSMNREPVPSAPYPAELQVPQREIMTYVKDAVTNWAKKGLQTVVFTHDLIDIAEKAGLASARPLQALLNRKAAKRVHLEAQLDKILTEAADLPDRTAVNRFLQASTMQQKWGYKPAWKSDAEVDPSLEREYNRLSPEGKKIVDQVFKYGEDTYAETQRLVNKEINDEFDALVQAAGAADERAKIEQDRASRLRTVGRVMPKLQGPYAPLKRFGDYAAVSKSAHYMDVEKSGDQKALNALKEDPKHYVVEFYDSLQDAKARARQMAPYFPGGRTEGFEKQKVYRDVQELPWGAIAKVKHAIAEQPDMKHKAAMNRLLTDLYLTMLSEGSARKTELKRIGVAGAAQDMLRSFATQGRAGAHFVSALEHNHDVQRHLTAMQADAKSGPAGATEERNRVMNEILARYAQGLDYRPTPFADKALRVTSIWMLLTSPAYYFQNATQPFMLTLPVLSGRFGNGAAWAALTKTYKEVGRIIAKNPSHTLDIDSLPLSPDEKAMLTRMRDDGRIDITIAQDLGRWTQGESKLDRGPLGKVLRTVNGMTQRVEMLNRVTSALAAYRLSKGNMEYVGRILDQTHGNYAASNAPRFMHANGAMRLVTQFRKFQLIQVSLLARLAKDAFANASPEERAVARAALGYILAHHMVMAGAMGLPAVNLVGFVAAYAFGDADEPKNFEKMLREAIDDKATADLLLKGVPAALGLDVSGRIGMGNAFALLPYTDIDLTSRKGLGETALGAGGAFLGGLAPRFADAAGYFQKGDYYKFLESSLPKGLSDGLKAYRFATEGITQKNNDVVMKPSEIDMFDVMTQALGLPSMTMTDRSRRLGDVIETERFYKERVTELKHKYSRAYRDNDAEGMTEAREEWASMAEAQRRNGLKPSPLSTLLKAPREQAKRESTAVEGVETKKANRRFVEQSARI